jgi:ER membrane protein SH3
VDFIISHGSFYAHVGVLLACFTVDYRVLFEPLTEETIQDGFQYYKTFYNAPLGIKVQNISFMPSFDELRTGTRAHRRYFMV